jgi:hypothetical protein
VEAGFTQQFALEEHGPGRVFAIHIGEDLIRYSSPFSAVR